MSAAGEAKLSQGPKAGVAGRFAEGDAAISARRNGLKEAER
jgi:hypothetical protein